MTTIEKIDNMTNDQFEKFLVQLFKGIGVKKVSLVHGLGTTRSLLVLDEEIKTTLIKAQITQAPVEAAFVHETLAEKTYREAQKALVITNYRFSQAAKELAVRHGVELWERGELAEVVARIQEVDPAKTWVTRLFGWFK